MRIHAGIVAVFLLIPGVASADEQHLSCNEISMTGPLFAGGISDTRGYHRTFEVQIAADQTTATISNNYNDAANTGTFPLKVSDATYEWNGAVSHNNGYDHFIIDRYTLTMRNISTPVTGGQVLDVTINYECRKLQKQV